MKVKIRWNQNQGDIRSWTGDIRSRHSFWVEIKWCQIRVGVKVGTGWNQLYMRVKLFQWNKSSVKIQRFFHVISNKNKKSQFYPIFGIFSVNLELSGRMSKCICSECFLLVQLCLYLILYNVSVRSKLTIRLLLLFLF